MTRLLILFFGCFFLFTCSDPDTEYKLNINYLDSIFFQIRKVDPSAKILFFRPENSFFEFSRDEIREDYSYVDSVSRNGNVSFIAETDFGKETYADDDFSKIFSRTEYYFINNRLSEKKYTDSSGTQKKIFRYKWGVCREILLRSIDDSGVFILRYKNNNLISKTLLDKNKRQVLSLKLIYNDIGNPDYVYTRSSEDYFEKFEFNNQKRELILSRFDNKRKFQWVRYAQFNALGLPVYEERFNRYPKGFVLRKESYSYDDRNEIESLEASYSDGTENKRFNFIYTKRDSLSNWTEREIYQNNFLFSVTKRKILYRR
jgi:hypothetical protein